MTVTKDERAMLRDAPDMALDFDVIDLIVGILALKGQWPGDEADAEVDAALKDVDPRGALLDEARDLPCYAARGEPTYECRHDALCPACALRGRIDAARGGGR